MSESGKARTEFPIGIGRHIRLDVPKVEPMLNCWGLYQNFNVAPHGIRLIYDDRNLEVAITTDANNQVTEVYIQDKLGGVEYQIGPAEDGERWEDQIFRFNLRVPNDYTNSELKPEDRVRMRKLIDKALSARRRSPLPSWASPILRQALNAILSPEDLRRAFAL